MSKNELMAENRAETLTINKELQKQYLETRKQTCSIVTPLEKEDFVVQPIIDVSPPKWHLGHSTWFFETMVLREYSPLYKVFHPQYHLIFNSYYDSLGERVARPDRGFLSRPTVDEVMTYRKYVDEAMENFLVTDFDKLGEENRREAARRLQIGFNHEQQHQELLMYDIKYILGHNPLFPVYDKNYDKDLHLLQPKKDQIEIEADNYEIGYLGTGFHFDNEKPVHTVYVPDLNIGNHYISTGEWLEFIQAGGYQNFEYWLQEAWQWVQENRIEAPMYWHKIEGEYFRYTLSGLKPLDMDTPVMHISYYEADAFARFAGKRLPTEAEWEVAAQKAGWEPQLWNWTQSAYLPYPGYKTEKGALGEYNGKFMINQMVLRGGSIATAEGHYRHTYRNFFHPHLRWMFGGAKLINS